VCLEYARAHAKYVLETDGLYALSPHLLKRLVREDRLCAAEDDLFRAVLRWAMHRVQREEVGHLSGDIAGVSAEGGMGASDSIDVLQTSLNLSADLDVSQFFGGSMLGGGGGAHVSVNDSVNASLGWLQDGFNGLELGRGAEEGGAGGDGERGRDGLIGASNLETMRPTEGSKWQQLQRRRIAKMKKLLKSWELLDLLRFPIMSQFFFHQVVEPSGLVPSRLLLERYQYHHGSLTYNPANPRLHHRLPLWGGKGCYRCCDPSHPNTCERWVVKCVPTESGIGFAADKLCYKAVDIRTCGGDLWGLTVFPPGTDERELRGGHGMGLSRSLNRTAGAEGGTAHTQLGVLAPNEWALNLRRLSQDTRWTLKQASAGLSLRFESLNEAFWELSTQSNLNINQSSPYTYSSSAWVVWRQSHIQELNPLSSDAAGVDRSGLFWGGAAPLPAAAGGDAGETSNVRQGKGVIYAEIHFQSFAHTSLQPFI